LCLWLILVILSQFGKNPGSSSALFMPSMHNTVLPAMHELRPGHARAALTRGGTEDADDLTVARLHTHFPLGATIVMGVLDVLLCRLMF
jgi:hypothetical protein